DAITPEFPSPILVIAGDLGHCNTQSKLLLTYLAENYENVLFCFGNHDLYLFSSDEYVGFKDSADRWESLKADVQHIPNIIALDGNTVTIQGVTFGGSGLWYDFTYGMKLG